MQILLNFKSLRKDTLSLIFCRPLQTAKRKEYQCQYPCIYIYKNRSLFCGIIDTNVYVSASLVRFFKHAYS